MANVTIDQLPPADPLTTADVIPVVQSGEARQAAIPSLDTVPTAAANVSLGLNKIIDVTDPASPQDAATKNYVDAQIAAISNQSSGFTGVITGCGVVWTGSLNFTVAAGTYAINGTSYSIAQTNLTLSAADGTNDRFDVVAVNTSSAAVVILGTPANPALIPTVDPATQLYLTAISVPANATTPGNITSTILYAENAGSPTEWTASSSGTTWALGSTNNPHAGTKDIEATSLTAAAYAQLQKPSGTFDLSTVNSLVFYIRSKATWNSNRSLTIEFLNAGALVGNALTFREGSFGFVSSNTTSYQQIVIPISSFNVGNTSTNQIRFISAGSGGSAIGFYLDDVSLQAGVTIGSQNFMVWRGPWSSSTAYVKNDVASNTGRLWVTLLPNTNSTPSDTNTNWQALDGPVIPELRVLTSSSTLPADSSVVYVDTLQLNVGAALTIPSTSAVLIIGQSATTSTLLVPTVLRLKGSDFIPFTTNLVDIPGLLFTAVANATYEVDALLFGASNNTNGVKFSIAYSGTHGANENCYITANTNAGSVANGVGFVGVATGNNYWTDGNNGKDVAKLWAVIGTTGSGNITMQVANVSNTNTTTIKIGSRMTITRIA